MSVYTKFLMKLGPRMKILNSVSPTCHSHNFQEIHLFCKRNNNTSKGLVPPLQCHMPCYTVYYVFFVTILCFKLVDGYLDNINIHLCNMVSFFYSLWLLGAFLS